MILIRPRFDKHTNTTYGWAEELAARVAVSEDLAHARATHEELVRALQRHPDCAFVVYFGHGCEHALFGQPPGEADLTKTRRDNLPTLISVDGNSIKPAGVASKKVYAVACSAGSRLGPALKKRGGSFVGYSNSFEAIPHVAECSEIVNSAVVAWANGAAARDVARQVRKGWRRLAKSCRAGGSKAHIPDERRSHIGAFALYNRDSVVFY